MIISSGNIGMESARLYKSTQSSLSYVGTSVSDGEAAGGRTSFNNLFLEKETGDTNSDDLAASESEVLFTESNPVQEAYDRYQAEIPIKTLSTSLQSQKSVSDKFQELHQQMIQNLFYYLFGFRCSDKAEGVTSADESGATASEDFNYQLVSTTDYFESYTEETESTFFQTTGVVKTEDGREMNINVNVSMSRQFVSYCEERVSNISYEVTDPLVINLSDAPAGLSEVKYFFDLDADGEEEEISELSTGSGYLALDKSEDGIINDGSELFGTASGDGFKDLSQYDSDGNGWIDEADDIFSKLKIWTKDEDGNDVLYTLKDKNIGALYLGSADTEFSLNNSLTNDTNGIIRKTGIFLYEDGNVGTLQHVDLVS